MWAGPERATANDITEAKLRMSKSKLGVPSDSLSRSLKIGVRNPVWKILTAVRRKVGKNKHWVRDKSLKFKKRAFVAVTDKENQCNTVVPQL